MTEPITTELRGVMSHTTMAGIPLVELGEYEFASRCDAIDAIHANLELENESLRRELDRTRGEWDYWESTHVELPKDADGVPIHIGDEMEGVDKYDSLNEVTGKAIGINFESDGTVDVAIQAWNSDGKSWHRAYLDPDASVYRHHHAPTVEDVLREFALAVCKDDALTIRKDVVDEYAAKLRLAGDAE